MTLQQLKYFRTLAHVQHYTRASEILLISQPSLSYSMAQLESELNVSLFEKNGKKVTLSRYGEVFLDYVERSLDLLDDGISTLKNAVDPLNGSVMLGYIYSISSSFIPDMIDKFRKQESNASIKFTFLQNVSNILIDNLNNGKIDLAFCAEYDKSVNYVPIFKQRLYLVVPQNHHLANKKGVNLEDIKNEPFILLNKSSSLRQLCDEAFDKINIKPNISFEAEECNAVISFVSLNYGISIIPEVPSMNSNVSVVNLKNPEFSRNIYMCWKNEKYMSSPVKKVKNFILENYSITK